MKFLVIGDHEFGQRDRETDLIHRTLSMILHSNAKRHEDDLVVYGDGKSYLSSVAEHICSIYDEPITYEQTEWPQASPGPTTTNLVWGGSGSLRSLIKEFDPAIDYIGCFSDDPANCDDAKIALEASKLGHIVGFVHSMYGSYQPPPSLLATPTKTVLIVSRANLETGENEETTVEFAGAGTPADQPQLQAPGAADPS